MYFRIMIATFLFSLQLGASSPELCFEVEKQNYMIKELSDQKYSLTHKESNEAIYYYCSNKKGEINCSAEDDSGQFKLKEKQIKLGQRQYFGTPDELIHLLEYAKPNWIALKECK